VWRVRSSQEKSVAAVAHTVESALVRAGFKPALTTDAGQGAIVWHSV